MATQRDSIFEPMAADGGDVLASLLPRPVTVAEASGGPALVATPIVASLVEFDLDDHPVIRADALVPGERLVARTTVPLRRAQLGASVLVLCEKGDPRLPIIIGVIATPATAGAETTGAPTVIQADEERYVVTAEREIVLRCGESSITLTRAGKVIIKGKYILSRSSGYNKIKGAAVDIN